MVMWFFRISLWFDWIFLFSLMIEFKILFNIMLLKYSCIWNLMHRLLSKRPVMETFYWDPSCYHDSSDGVHCIWWRLLDVLVPYGGKWHRWTQCLPPRCQRVQATCELEQRLQWGQTLETRKSDTHFQHPISGMWLLVWQVCDRVNKSQNFIETWLLMIIILSLLSWKTLGATSTKICITVHFAPNLWP